MKPIKSKMRGIFLNPETKYPPNPLFYLMFPYLFLITYR